MYVILEETGDYYKYYELYSFTIYTNLDYVKYLVKQLNGKSRVNKYNYEELKICKKEYKSEEVIKDNIKSKLTQEEL